MTDIVVETKAFENVVGVESSPCPLTFSKAAAYEVQQSGVYLWKRLS